MAITDALCRSFLDLWWHFDPAAATRAGITAHDGRLGSFDPDAIRQHVAAFRSLAGAVEELDVEGTADEIDRTALLDHLRVLLFRFEHEQPYRRNPALWLEHLGAALEGLLARETPDPALAAAALERIRAIPGFLSAARDSLRQPPQFLVETALLQLGALPALLDAADERFAAEWTAEGGAAAAVLTEARVALEQLAGALRAAAADSDPHAVALGEDAVDHRLHYEHASIHNAAEVWRSALRLASEVESEVSALAAAIEAARPWREVYASLALESVVWSELAAELREALGRHERLLELGGIASAAPPLSVEPLSSFAQVLEPDASYRPAGLATPPAILLGEAERIALPWIAARLGIPGLHLHRCQRALLGPLVRRHIAATSTPLGWTWYAQELVRELDPSTDPETALVERVELLRAVHLAIVDLGIHLRQMTPADAVGHLTSHVPTDHAAALAQVRRLACHPTAACAALLGRLELRRLREDARAAQGSAFSIEALHREVFAYGGLPVPLIRWGMGLDA